MLSADIAFAAGVAVGMVAGAVATVLVAAAASLVGSKAGR